MRLLSIANKRTGRRRQQADKWGRTKNVVNAPELSSESKVVKEGATVSGDVRCKKQLFSRLDGVDELLFREYVECNIETTSNHR